MQHRYPTTDAPIDTDRDDARRLGKGAIALLALGAPFVATAPAAADGGGRGQHGDNGAAAQTSAHASTDASAGGNGQGAASAAGATEPSAASAAAAPQPSAAASAAPPHASASEAPSGGAADVGASGNAAVETGRDTGSGDTGHKNASETAGRGDSEVRDGARAAGRGEARVGGAATAHASVNGQAHTGAENGAMSGRRGSGEAGAHARGESRAEASVHGADQENLRGEGNGGAGASAHAGARGNKRHVGRRTVEGHGERGLSDVRVTPQQEGRAGGRTSAVVKASPALEAAIRAEAREAARAEIHARFARPEAAKRFAVKRRFEGRGVQRLRATADTHAEALLRILETAWTTGGPARANALLELCLGRPAPVVSSPDRREHAVRERQERTDGRRGRNAVGIAQARGIGEIVGAARGEDRGTGEIVGAARESVEVAGGDSRAPGAPVETPSSRPMPGDLPETTEVFQAPQEADRPRQPQGSATLPGATQPQGSTTGPGITTGASAPSGVRRQASAAGLQRQLPFTGGELPLTIIAGATALAAGALLRRRVQGGAR